MTRSGISYGMEGPGLRENEWDKAIQLLDEAIISNKYSFLPKYTDIFSFTNENNAEAVFDVQYITGANPVLGSTFAWVLVPDNWFQSQGKATQGGLTIRPVSKDLLNSHEAGTPVKRFLYNQGIPTKAERKHALSLRSMETSPKVPFQSWARSGPSILFCQGTFLPIDVHES